MILVDANWSPTPTWRRLAIEHNCVLCSTDDDFARFASLKWTNPIAGGRR